MLTKANLMTPEQRIARFEWLNEIPNLQLTGWHGIVQNMQAIPGGTLITLEIYPQATAGGGSTTIGDFWLEQYSILNGSIFFASAMESPKPHGRRVCTD
jgi:hypothetical protein